MCLVLNFPPPPDRSFIKVCFVWKVVEVVQYALFGIAVASSLVEEFESQTKAEEISLESLETACTRLLHPAVQTSAGTSMESPISVKVHHASALSHLVSTASMDFEIFSIPLDVSLC